MNESRVKKVGKTGLERVLSPIFCQIEDIRVNVGDRVESGDVLFIVSAMKLEVELTSDFRGRVGKICVEKGDVVHEDGLLLIMGEEDSIDVSLNEEALDCMAEEIYNDGKLYLISNGHGGDIISDFKDKLGFLDIDVELMNGDEFKEDSILLVVSKTGYSESIRQIIKVSRLKKVKVYCMSSDFKSSLVLLSDNSIIFKNYFDIQLSQAFDHIIQKIADSKRRFKIRNVRYGNVRAPSICRVVEVKVKIGDYVEEGDVLLTVEVMKMEMDILSEFSGTVTDIFVAYGDSLIHDEAMMNIDRNQV